MNTAGSEPSGFELALRDASHEHAEPELDAKGREDRNDETPVASEESAAPPEAPERSERPSLDNETDGDMHADAERALDAQQGVTLTENNRRGEAVQSEETAGKGTGSPRTSTAPHEAAPLPASVQPQDLGDTATGLAGGSWNAASAANARGSETNAAAVRGAVASGALETGSGLRTKSAQAGYGARSAATLQMLDQSRDSVFKQILMKLNNDGGGDLRMTLQPPELGELDVRLTVDGGNRLTLMIAAERSDLSQVLQRNLDELKQSLQANGLDVQGAEIQTREEFARRDQQASNPSHGGDEGQTSQDGSETAKDAARHAASAGYVTADGLDFWA
ncbi:MAG: flagellar hook-length control protein FliK [Planctomycetota bacterium]